MDHTYCTVAKTFPKRRDTYASRIEKLRAANGKDLSVTESLMVEAGAWLKVVIKDEDEEEEICHAVASEEEEEEDGESCRMVAGVEERCPAAVHSPAGCVTQSPTHPPVLSPSEKMEKSEEISEMVEKHPDDSPSSDSPNYSPSLEKPLITEEENEEERGSSVISERLEEEEEEESESDEAYLERAAARIREFQMQLKAARTFSVEKFQDSAEEIQRHTGLPDYSTFLALYDFLRPKGSSQMQYWGSVFKAIGSTS
ncbi:uncharacterized protein [Centroberyx affinis]|uniref:uncharacterized protein isoform X2 n=1 Tax=Centroberyx affinis TaxID=166261 RepID=UPI003A5BDFF0